MDVSNQTYPNDCCVNEEREILERDDTPSYCSAGVRFLR